MLPGQLGDMDQAVDTAEVDEGSKVHDARDHTGPDLSLLQLRQECLANLRLRLLKPSSTGQHHVVAVLIQLDDLCFEGLADVGLEIPDSTHLDEGRREEPAQPDVEDESTLDDLDDLAFDHAVFFLDLLDRAPGALVLRPLLRQDQPAFLVLLLQDESLNRVSDSDDLVRVDVVLDGEFTGGDHTLGLVADIEKYFVSIDLDDGAFDDVTVVEVFDGRVDRGQKIVG